MSEQEFQSPPSHSGEGTTNETLSAKCLREMDTQPISNSFNDSLMNDAQSAPWGLLFGLCPDMPQTQLTLQEYTIGRNEGPLVNLVLPRPPEKEKSRFNVWLSYSRVQLFIRKLENGSVEIEDNSSNGTFVNGKRLKKGIPTPLANNSEIALSLTNNKVLMFADLRILDDPTIPITLRNDYRFSKQLGQGACGEVRLAFSKQTGTPVAVKIVHRSRFFVDLPNDANAKNSNYAQAIREAKLMRELSHPCIIKIMDVFDEASFNDLFMVLEYAPGGELFDRIVANGKLTEDIGKFIFFQLSLAVQYLHFNGITHRDLKPENVLLSSDDDYPVVKLADFGLSKIVDQGTVMKTFCGTPTYLAPEIVKTKGSGVYSKKVDMWSLGVILFAALAGYPPFSSERKDMSLEDQILKGSYSFNHERWIGVSESAISLIKGLLTVIPSKRFSANLAVNHHWVANDHVMKKVDEVVFGGKGIKYFSQPGNTKSIATPTPCRAIKPRSQQVAPHSAKAPLRVSAKVTADQKRSTTPDVTARPLRRRIAVRDNVEVAVNPSSKRTVAVTSNRAFSPALVKKTAVISTGETVGRVRDQLTTAKTPRVRRVK